MRDSTPMELARGRFSERILASRTSLLDRHPAQAAKKVDEEGGCGVVGFASSVPVRGRHIFEPSIQMHNRGNGKGGGIAAACLVPEQMGVTSDILRDDYLLQIALLDPKAEAEVEQTCIAPYLKVDHKVLLEPVADYRDLGLEVKPPDVVRYFVRVKDDVLSKFAEDNGLSGGPNRDVEDECIYQNSFRLNQRYYASLGEKRAFVLSHARNLALFKIVGYAEQVVQYYGLENLEAQVWIAHQRYPTRGRVWHPAGSHPFIGMNEGLVHNGDFANYFGVCEYLRQHNIEPQFLTDTEVAALLFDLWSRVYKYPLEYVIEAMAPTTELDFDSLPEEKQRIYRAIQAVHMHGSPDGPWSFIIARSDPDHERFQLLGITDASMLRPQVFALQDGDASIGLIASEKQAIDATLHSLSEEDNRFRPIADRYWNARGGSHTDGGAFSFTVRRDNGTSVLSCADKFGRAITTPAGEYTLRRSEPKPSAESAGLVREIDGVLDAGRTDELFTRISTALGSWNLDRLRWLIDEICRIACADENRFDHALELLTLLNDRRYDYANMKPSVVLQIVRDGISHVLDSVPSITSGRDGRFKRVDWETRLEIRPPQENESVLVVLAREFPPEGEDAHSRLLVEAHQLGWKRFIVYGLKGQRFTGCGFGPETNGVRIDIYGSSGDYCASGVDGMEIHFHGNGQDQLAQIMKDGRLVVYGDVGQTFMYGAKGGEVYVMGNAAGRPLINAVGRPRVVINGTCLDYLAEAFMAGDPHAGGGFVVLNGIEFDDHGRIRDQQTPYPGSNLFSLASGGAIFARDPHKRIVPEQLNGGELTQMTHDDWQLILPYLEANERYFGISIEHDLLTVDGVRRSPLDVYRKIRAVRLDVLAAESIPE